MTPVPSSASFSSASATSSFVLPPRFEEMLSSLTATYTAIYPQLSQEDPRHVDLLNEVREAVREYKEPLDEELAEEERRHKIRLARIVAKHDRPFIQRLQADIVQHLVAMATVPPSATTMAARA